MLLSNVLPVVDARGPNSNLLAIPPRWPRVGRALAIPLGIASGSFAGRPGCAGRTDITRRLRPALGLEAQSGVRSVTLAESSVEVAPAGSDREIDVARRKPLGDERPCRNRRQMASAPLHTGGRSWLPQCGRSSPEGDQRSAADVSSSFYLQESGAAWDLVPGEESVTLG